MWSVLQTNRVLFEIRDVRKSGEKSLEKYEGLSARTLPEVEWRNGPAPFEVMVKIYVTGKRARIVQASIDPKCLVPWKPAVGSKVVVVDQYADLFTSIGTVLRIDRDTFIVKFSDEDISLDRSFTVDQLAILESLE